ncbi:permease [Streptomyces sp. NBC_00503]|uniref:permease n=1 Tax=Streptomyces sp. NBC_00503 TaxID=2903659 RepID=UPI002E821C14|nr:permease [Streptomyces sp. NBC_00503]WUD81824.1 permease [Streptomyces sp. NBC_00503]
MLDTVLDILGRTASDVGHSIAANWPFLLISVIVASAIPVYIGADKLSSFLRRKTLIAIIGAIILATLTPFCSCGTTAVVLGALASEVPWAPVVTFMVSSPMTSPEEYVYSIGLFGFDFATTFFVAAMGIGLFAGGVTWLIEKTGWLKGQARVTASQASKKVEEGGCCGAEDDEEATGGVAGGGVSAGNPAGGGGGLARTALLNRPIAPAPAPAPVEEDTLVKRWKLDEFGRELAVTSKRLALYFLGFATLGFLVINSIPTHVLTGFLGEGNAFAVPLAALIGIPVYLNSDGSLPLVATLMQGGMAPGPAMAFLITGAGTSVGAISGMLLIARWRVVSLVVGILFFSACVMGFLAPLWLS